MSTFSSKLQRRVEALRQARHLADAPLLARMIVFASLVPVMTRLQPRTLERLLRRPVRRPEPASLETATRIVEHLRLARRIASPLVRPGCLTRGLTLYYFLRRAGFDVTLCFGMGGAAGQFSGHCWLSRAGGPFLEAPDPRPLYAHVFSIPFTSSSSDALPRFRDLT